MKKLISMLLVLAMAISLTACVGNQTPVESSTTEVPTSAATSEPVAESTTPEPTPAYAVNPSEAKIAFICEPAGTEAFILQAISALKDEGMKYGVEYKVMECATADDFLTNAQAAAQEGYTLIIGLGWKTADAIKQVSTDYPDASRYAVIDTTVDNPTVTSIYFDMSEPCYVLGVLMAKSFPDEAAYGMIGSYQTQTTYRQRWGFMEGVKSVNPDAEFVQNFVNSYADPITAKALALQQVAQGIRVICSMCATPNNAAIADAALEAPGTIFTSGQEVDTTTSDNPYITSDMLKNTGAVTAYIIDHYFAGTLEGGTNLLGLKSGAVGVVHVTTESANYLSEFVTADAIALAKEAADKIISGAIVLDVPNEG